MEKKMVDENLILDGIAIFDRPVQIDENRVYGVLYDKRYEHREREIGNECVYYLTYMLATEQFLKNGGKISDDGQYWTYPDDNHSLICDNALRRIFRHTMNDIVGFTQIEFDDPIVWNTGEVDNEDNRLITDSSLIERYKDIYNQSETNNEYDLPF